MENTTEIKQKFADSILTKLKAKPVHDLRQLTRAVGAQATTSSTKDDMISKIMDVATGVADPRLHSIRGAKPKSQDYDKTLAADVMRCKEMFSKDYSGDYNNIMTVESNSDEVPAESRAEGLLVSGDNGWYLLGFDEISVDENFVSRYKLREGDFISGRCLKYKKSKCSALNAIYTICGIPSETLTERPIFDNLPIIPVNKRLSVTKNASDLTGRLIDVLAPIGQGQRVIISSEHGFGKSYLLKELTKGIVVGSPQIKVIYLAVDIAPDEEVELKNEFRGCDVFTSKFDEAASAHRKTANIALAYAKRKAELGLDVLFVIDDLTKLTSAYNTAQFVINELSSAAFVEVKRILSSARNLKNGGSITILTALDKNNTLGNKLIFDALSPFANVRIAVSDSLARKHIYPALDMDETYAIGTPPYIDSECMKLANDVRGKTIDEAMQILLGN